MSLYLMESDFSLKMPLSPGVSKLEKERMSKGKSKLTMNTKISI